MCQCACNLRLSGVVTVGPKWQIVIPKDVRNEIGIEIWDSLAVIVKEAKYIWIIQNKDMSSFMKYIDTGR